jgi:hypothetical protein
MEDGLKNLDSILPKIDGGMNGIGKGLGIGTSGIGGHLRVRGFEIDNTWKKDPLDPLL